MDLGNYDMPSVSSSVLTNVPPWWDVKKEGSHAYVGVWGPWEISVPPIRFFCEPKTVQNIKHNKKNHESPFDWYLVISNQIGKPWKPGLPFWGSVQSPLGPENLDGLKWTLTKGSWLCLKKKFGSDLV